MSYNPLNWYWKNSAGAVYSSAENATVAQTDAGFEAFLTAGNTPTVWPSDTTGAQTNAALYEVLQPYGLGSALAPAPTQAELVAYAGTKQEALRDGGINVNVGSTSTPDEVNVASDADGRTLVTGCVQLIGVASQAGQSAPTFQWINNDGTQITLTGPQMMTVALKLGGFVQATYSTLGAVLAAIAAGTIATYAQIDTPPASVGAWPATSY